MQRLDRADIALLVTEVLGGFTVFARARLQDELAAASPLPRQLGRRRVTAAQGAPQQGADVLGRVELVAVEDGCVARRAVGGGGW